MLVSRLTPHGERGLRADPVRRADAVRGRTAGEADRAGRPGPGGRGDRGGATCCAGSFSTTDSIPHERHQPALPVAETPVRVGDELTFTEPLVLGYGFGNWRLQPADGTADGVFAPQNTRPAAPDPVGGDIQVRAFNVLNYFVTLTGPDARGAGNAEQFERAGRQDRAGDRGARRRDRHLDGDRGHRLHGLRPRRRGRGPGRSGRPAQRGGRRRQVDLRAAARRALRGRPGRHPQRDHLPARRGQPVGDAVGLVDEDVWFNAREPIAQTFRPGRRLHGGGQPLQVQEPGSTRRGQRRQRRRPGRMER